MSARRGAMADFLAGKRPGPDLEGKAAEGNGGSQHHSDAGGADERAGGGLWAVGSGQIKNIHFTMTTNSYGPFLAP